MKICNFFDLVGTRQADDSRRPQSHEYRRGQTGGSWAGSVGSGANYERSRSKSREWGRDLHIENSSFAGSVARATRSERGVAISASSTTTKVRTAAAPFWPRRSHRHPSVEANLPDVSSAVIVATPSILPSVEGEAGVQSLLTVVSFWNIACAITTQAKQQPPAIVATPASSPHRLFGFGLL